MSDARVRAERHFYELLRCPGTGEPCVEGEARRLVAALAAAIKLRGELADSRHNHDCAPDCPEGLTEAEAELVRAVDALDGEAG